MSTKIISTYIAAGYDLAPSFSVLEITNTGGVSGTGVSLSAPATVENDGLINGRYGANGVTANAAASVINGSAYARGAEIQGYSGVFMPGGVSTVTNFGTIHGDGTYGDGVFLVDGGVVTNGAANDSGALITGDESGVVSSAAGKVVNFGTIQDFGAYGIYLKSGSITNGSTTDIRALLFGDVKIQSGTAAVSNFGSIRSFSTIHAGVYIEGGGTVTNGAAADPTAEIFSFYTAVVSSALGRMVNFGTIVGQSAVGVYLRVGGTVTNGSTLDTRALIQGGAYGVEDSIGSVTLSNFGTISGTNTVPSLESGGGVGLKIDGGRITNGSTLDVSAEIEGQADGIEAMDSATTVSNFGIIQSADEAISLKVGGTVTNGAANDTTAFIYGAFAVSAQGFTKISNFGAIDGDDVIYISGGGSLTNGSSTDTSASIVGYSGVVIRDAPGTVVNFGSIIATGTHGALSLFSEGEVTNGSAMDTTALIDGGNLGVDIAGVAGTIANFGTIEAELGGSGASVGAYMSGGTVTNGSASDTVALIRGSDGVELGSGAPTTLTNFGTVIGFGQYSVLLASAADVLNVEAGSAFVGKVAGYGGTLNLASGVGTISGLTSAGDVTVSGSMAKTTFDAFATLGISAGATFTDAGVVSVLAAHTINDAGVLTLGAAPDSIVSSGLIEVSGTLTLAGAVKNAGTITVNRGSLVVDGAVTLAGQVTINGGRANFASTFVQAVTFGTAGGTLELSHSQTYTGSISGFATTPTTSLDLDDIVFTSGVTKATYSGTSIGGTLTVTDGSHTAKIKLIGNYLSSIFSTASDGHGGTLVTDPMAPKAHVLTAALASFGNAPSSTADIPLWSERAVRPWLAAPT